MDVNFIPSIDTGENCSIYVWTDNEEIKQMTLLKGFLNLS